MAGKKEDAVTHEVENRLEELFTDDGDDGEEMGFEDQSGHPELRGLKAVVLSIDWEINDEIMNNLMEQIEGLKKVLKNDRILLLFLQLLGSVGKYVKANKAKSHPDSIKLLSSVYSSFEKVLLTDDMPIAKRKKLLQSEVNRFKELKEQISLKRAAGELIAKEAAAEAKRTADEVKAKPEPSGKAAPEVQISPELEIVLKEVKQTIQSEFNALRVELKKWLKNR